MINIKQYLPIRIFHTYYSYGWWWGSKFYFSEEVFSVYVWLRIAMRQNMLQTDIP